MLSLPMTAVDWVIVAFALALAASGYRRGFVVAALSLAGFAAGALLGSRIGPLLLAEGARSPYAPLFALGGALLVGGLVANVLETVAFRLRRMIRLPGLGVADGLLGAALMGALALGIAWIIGAVALQTPWLSAWRGDIQRSEVLRRLNDLLPPSGPILNALARFDPLPALTGPAPDVAPPSPRVLRTPGVRAAAPSVVRIQGTACGLGVGGSGWVAGDGLVVTNAHVVAGQRDTVVQTSAGGSLAAAVAHFDARNDVAVLRVAGLDAPPLALAPTAQAGTGGAILGYPLNGPFDARAARIGATQTVVADDAYGRGPVRRQLTTLRGVVRSGNSGGPVVDRRGRVLATVFAATTSGPPGGYGVPNAIVRAALADARRGAVASAGPCAR